MLDRWLEASDAHLPAPNLAYDAHAFERGLREALGTLGRASEWTPNGGCAAARRNGRLVIDCEGHPFVVGPRMLAPGPLRVAVRCAASGTVGAGSIWYVTPDKESFSGHRVPLPACGSGLAVREARVETAETVQQLRVDFARPRSGGRVEIDWIRIYGEDSESPLAEWTFDER